MDERFLKKLKKDEKINMENLREISLKLGKNYDYFDLNKVKIDKAPSNFFLDRFYFCSLSKFKNNPYKKKY